MPVERLALPLDEVDLAIGCQVPLSKAARCRLMRTGQYPNPVFSVAGKQVVLVSDVKSFLQQQRQRAPEERARNVERSRKAVAARQAKRAERRAAGQPTDPGLVVARAARAS